MSRGLRMTPEQYAAVIRAADSVKERSAPAQIVVVGAPKASKYRNKPTDGYASRKEAKRAAELKLMEKAGKIRNLKEQVRFELIPAQRNAAGRVDERECAYVADFCYEEYHWTDANGEPIWVKVVEDCKGMRTAVYRIKKKLMLHVHGIAIRET